MIEIIKREKWQLDIYHVLQHLTPAKTSQARLLQFQEKIGASLLLIKYSAFQEINVKYSGVKIVSLLLTGRQILRTQLQSRRALDCGLANK